MVPAARAMPATTGFTASRWLGFGAIETFSFDVDVAFTHPQWRGRIRASAPIQGSLTTEAVVTFDRALEDLLRSRFPAEPQQVLHRCWAVSGTL